MNEPGARRGRDRYDVVRGLRSDAFSVTALARDRLLERDVALTELRPELRADPIAGRLLTARLNATSDIALPAVPEVFDRGVDAAGNPWAAAEPVDAPSVAALIAGSPGQRFERGQVVRTARAVAAAMREVHANGVVHGALGPDTVLVADGRIRLIGFGPQPSELALPSDPATTAAAWARFTASLPTPSPEQAAGAAPGRRSDVYGFGCLLGALLDVAADEDPDRVVVALARLQASCVQPAAARRPASFAAILDTLDRLVPAGAAEDPQTWPAAARETITTVQRTAPHEEPTRVLAATAAPEATTERIRVARRGRPPAVGRRGRTRPRARRHWSPAARLAVAGAAVLAIVGAVVAHSVLVPAVATEKIVVPQVAGTSVENASRALTAAGVVVAGQHPSASSYPAGLVSGTDPGPGTTIESGGTVALLVSTGPGESPVPQLAGLDLAGARAALTTAGLAVGAVVSKDGPSREGTVLASQPAFGSKVPAGTAVEVVVASGRVRVPAGLTGQASQPVIDALAAAGLQAQSYSVDTDQYLTGVVLEVKPGEGARVPVGGIVTLVVARYVPAPPASNSGSPPSSPVRTQTPGATPGPTPGPSS